MPSQYCPICQTPSILVQDNPEKCPNCGWTLIPFSYYKSERQKGGIAFFSGNKNKEEEFENEIDLLREKWAKEKWQELLNLRQKLNLNIPSSPPINQIPVTNINQPNYQPLNLDENSIKELINQQIQECLPNLVETSLANLINNQSPLLTKFVQEVLDQLMSKQLQPQKNVEPPTIIPQYFSPQISPELSNIPQTNVPISSTSEQKQTIELNPLEDKIVKEYNQNLISLNFVEVIETMDSQNKRRTGMNEAPLFEESKRGDYCVINISNQFYLVPKLNLQLNEHSLKTLEILFYCSGHQRQSQIFKLIKPAKVVLLAENKWRLIEQGTLQF